MPSSNDFLRIVDERNWQYYRIPVSNNTVNGSDLAKIKFSSAAEGTDDDQPEPLKIFDPGYENVAALRSSITFVDGKSKNPSLEFRGYTFQALLKLCDFEDVTYLMIWGSIPSLTQKLAFRSRLANACRSVPQPVIEIVKALPPEAPYYTLIMAILSAFLAEQPDTIPAVAGRNLYHNNSAATDEGCIRTLAAFYVAVALAYCHRVGRAFSPHVYEGKPMIVNLLRMMGEINRETQEPEELTLRVLDQMWIQGCDHEINNSTSALLHAASSLSDPLSCVITAVSSGYGPLHFGAAESVYALIQDIGTPDRVAAVIDKCKTTGQRVPGVGHRMYKSWDPRTVHMKGLLRLLEANGRKDPLLDVALEMERQVKEDVYFNSRKLAVNLDAYWQFGLTALGFSSDAVLPLGLASFGFIYEDLHRMSRNPSDPVCIETTDESVRWFDQEIGNRLNPAVEEFYMRYCGIEGEKLVAHLRGIRDRAWQIRPYPCIGQWGFVTPKLPRCPGYGTILQRVKAEASLLDLGCCLGQDLRALAADGAPTTRLYGCDITSDFWELGYELFRDRHKFHATFYQESIFGFTKPEEQRSPLFRELQGAVDVVYMGSVLHLWNWEDQLTALAAIIHLTRKGSMVLGCLIGKTGGKEVVSAWKDTKNTRFMHNEETMHSIWREAGERTATQWKTSVKIDSISVILPEKKDWEWMGLDSHAVLFEALRIE